MCLNQESDDMCGVKTEGTQYCSTRVKINSVFLLEGFLYFHSFEIVFVTAQPNVSEYITALNFD